MRFTVVWKKSARDELAELWMAAADRNAITRVSDEIDKQLTENAHLEGYPLDNYRVLHKPPLSILFAVSAADRKAIVVEVRQTDN